MRNIFKYCVFLFLFSIDIVQAQTPRIDSLTHKLVTEKEDTAKVNTLDALSYEFTRNNPDTSIYFANKALALATKLDYKMGIANSYMYMGMAEINLGKYEEAMNNSNNALRIYDQLLISEKNAHKLKILKQKANAYNNIGNIYKMQSNYPGALENYFASLKIAEELGLKKAIAGSHNNIGTVYDDQGNYPEALRNYFVSLKVAEELGDKKGIAQSHNNIGIVYYEQGNYPEALKNHFTSLKIKQELGDKKGIAQSYNNIGVISYQQGNYPEALKNYFASLKIKEELGDKKGIAQSYYNIGNIYSDQSNYPEALKNYFASLKLFKELGEKKGMAGSSSAIGMIYSRQKKYSEAHVYLNEGLSLAKEIGSLEDIKASYSGLATLDSTEGNFEQAFRHYKLFIANRDSLVNEENTEKTVQFQMQYEFDKKETAIRAEHDKKDAVAKAELQKQKIQKYSFIGGIVLLTILALLLYNRFRLKRLLDLYEVRAGIASDLHDNIGSTLGSISYYSEMAQQLSGGKQLQLNVLLHKIEDSSSELVDEMSDIVWAINPVNDSFEKLTTRMSNYATDLLATRNINFSLQTKGVTESLRLSIEQRKNIFLIFKEAVYNAVKYACCSGFNASIHQTRGKLIIELADNGKGFDVNHQTSYNGNGITNMKKRAKEIGAELFIFSKNENGTQIRFELPIREF